MNEARKLILRLLKEDKITEEEAILLLNSIDPVTVSPPPIVWPYEPLRPYYREEWTVTCSQD